MNLGKVGKFIAEKRKEKGYTQEKMGEMLGVNGKTISKWERGVNAPDISLLSEISILLGITLDELLKGESVFDKKKENNIDGLINGLKFYNRLAKIKYIKIFIYCLAIVISGFSFLFLINNYNQFKIYSLSSVSDKYYVDGYIIYNQERNIIFINNVDIKDKNIGTKTETKIKYVSFSLRSSNKNIFSSMQNIDGENIGLSSFLLNKSYFTDEKVESNENIINANTDLTNLRIVIEYTTTDDLDKKISIPLRTNKEYSSNKILY